MDSSILPGSQVAMMTGTEDPGEKYFYNRDVFTWKFSTQWLRAKRQQDDCGGLWRIHDDLYDLSGWEKYHPGDVKPPTLASPGLNWPLRLTDHIPTLQEAATGWTSPEARTARRPSRLSMCLESLSLHLASSGSGRPRLQDITDLPFIMMASSKLSRGKRLKY